MNLFLVVAAVYQSIIVVQNIFKKLADAKVNPTSKSDLV